MFIDLQCSNCGKRQRLSNKKVEYTVKAIKDGWGSFGSALYCPECCRTWSERNADKPMADERSTFWVIAGIFFRGQEAEK